MVFAMPLKKRCMTNLKDWVFFLSRWIHRERRAPQKILYRGLPVSLHSQPIPVVLPLGPILYRGAPVLRRSGSHWIQVRYTQLLRRGL